MYFSANDTIYCAILAVLTLSGIAANLILLYMIICESPKHLSPYRIFLGNTALTQLLLSASLLTTSPRIFPQDYFLVNIYLGPVQLTTPWCCYMLYVTMLHFAMNSFVSLMVSMIYRCISLRNATINSCTVLQMCIAGYVIPFSMVVSCVNLEYSANKSYAAEVTHHMIANTESYAVVVAARILQPCVIWNIICCSILLLPMYATMYFCRWKILNYLDKMNSVRSSHNKLNIKRFVKALTIQSLVPTLSVFPPAIAYLLIQFGFLQPQLISYFIAPCLSIGPILDPLITIYYVSPYRRLMKSLFSIQSDSSQYSGSNQIMRPRSQSLKPAMFAVDQAHDLSLKLIGLHSTDFIYSGFHMDLIPHAVVTKTALRIGYSLNHIGRYNSQLGKGTIEVSQPFHSIDKAVRHGKRSQVSSGFGTTFAEHRYFWSSAYGNNTYYGYSSFLDVRCCPRSEINRKSNERNNICGYDYYKSSYNTMI